MSLPSVNDGRRGAAGAVRGEVDAARRRHAALGDLDRVRRVDDLARLHQVEEVLVGEAGERRAGGAGVAARRERGATPRRPGGGEDDRAPRVVLVVEIELAEPRGERLRSEPRVEVGAEAQQVPRVPRSRPVGADQPVLETGREVLDVRVGERLGTRDRVVARSAVHEVVVPAAEHHVVGVVRVVGRHVDLEVTGLVVRAEVVRRDVELLLQGARDVDRRRLDLTRRVDELAQDVAVDHLRVGVADQERVDPEERLAEGRRPAVRARAAGVAARHDPAVVAEHAVLAGAARHPVAAPAADQVVVLGVAVEHVVSAAGVDGVVARLAVDLVGAADVGVAAGRRVARVGRRRDVARARRQRRRALARRVVAGAAAQRALGAGCEEVRGQEVRPTGRVVEQVDAADDELAVRVVRRRRTSSCRRRTGDTAGRSPTPARARCCRCRRSG